MHLCGIWGRHVNYIMCSLYRNLEQELGIKSRFAIRRNENLVELFSLCFSLYVVGPFQGGRFKCYIMQWVWVGHSFPGKKVLRKCTVHRY